MALEDKKVKNIHYIENHMKYTTRELEEIVREFFSSINNTLDYQVRLLAIDEKEDQMCIGSYRCIDDELKEDLQEWVKSENTDHFHGKSYLFSNKFTYKHIEGDFIVALKYDDTGCDEFIKTYLKFLVEHLLNMIEMPKIVIKENSDGVLYLKNQIYVWSRKFIEERISRNAIQLTQLSYLSGITAIEEISKMTYESENLSKKYIAISNNSKNVCDIELKSAGLSVMLHEIKKVRKLLEITYQSGDDGLYLLYNRKCIAGFISPKSIFDSYFLIEFKGNGVWKFSQEKGNENNGGQGIEFGGVNPKIICNNDSFQEKFRRCFQEIFGCSDKLDIIWELVNEAKHQKHGTMLVFLDDKNVKREQERLSSAGFEIKVNQNINTYMKQLAAIDGAILIGKTGNVYAIGTILDGKMPEDYGLDMARGARYNLAIKYSHSHKEQKNLIVVFSEDGYANLISSGKEI